MYFCAQRARAEASGGRERPGEGPGRIRVQHLPYFNSLALITVLQKVPQGPGRIRVQHFTYLFNALV